MRTTRKRPRELTFKQRQFAEEYIRNKGNGVQAALTVYDTADYNTANQIAIKNLQKPTIRDEMSRQMDSSGPTLEAIAKTPGELLHSGSGMNRLRTIRLILELWGVLD